MEPSGLTCYDVVIAESDIRVCTERNLEEEARQALLSCRAQLENYLEKHPFFGTSFRPVPAASGAPQIVEEMAGAALLFGVGPMASVAGAIAQQVGLELLKYSRQVVVENGGDLFLAGGARRKARVFPGAGLDPVNLLVEDSPGGVGLCTSSATIGHSRSLGEADSVTVLSPTAVLADAAATSFCNMVRSVDDIEKVIEKASGYPEVRGIVVVMGGSVGLWGQLEMT